MSALVSDRHLQIIYKFQPKSIALFVLPRLVRLLDDRELPKFLCLAANKKICDERDAYAALTIVQLLPQDVRKQPAALSLVDRAFEALRKHRPATIH